MNFSNETFLYESSLFLNIDGAAQPKCQRSLNFRRSTSRLRHWRGTTNKEQRLRIQIWRLELFLIFNFFLVKIIFVPVSYIFFWTASFCRSAFSVPKVSKYYCSYLFDVMLTSFPLELVQLEVKKDGRLASAYFWPNYKYFDQLLQTVENKTTVLILVFKEFLQISILLLISELYAKGYHDHTLKTFCLTVLNHFVEEPFYVSESFGYRKIFCLRGEYHHFQ